MQLYVHVPFCKSKCLYCDFTSFRPKNEADVFDYLTALNLEIDKVFEDYPGRKITTVYIGGGTPSALTVEEFDSIVESLEKHIDLRSLDEFTVECNPESITEEKLYFFKEVGVTRLSIGVQSLSDKNLHSVGRLHTAEQAISAVKLATSIFDNVSVDFIVGLPHDDFAFVKEEIATLAPLVQHVSVYTLQLEENTPLERLVKAGKISLPDDDTTEDLLQVAMDELNRLGFSRYEISNFARQGYESKHNVGYWTREEYYGVGLGASSCVTVDGVEKRLVNTADFSRYTDYLKRGEYPTDEVEILTDEEIKREQIMLGLRLRDGIDEELLSDKSDLIECEFSRFFLRNNGKISFTDVGMNVSNYVLSSLIF